VGLRGAVGVAYAVAAAPAMMAPMPTRSLAAPAPRAPASPLRRIGDALFGRTRQAPPPPPAGAAAPLGPHEQPVLRLSGKLTVTRDGRLVVTIAVARPFAFSPPATVVLVLEAGSRHEAKVDAKLSSAPCEAQPGQVLRVVVEPGTVALFARVRSLELAPDVVIDVDNG
jgi:hypothetical protein